MALRRGRLDEADELLERAVASSLKTPSNPDVPNTLKALGELRLRQGRLDEAQA